MQTFSQVCVWGRAQETYGEDPYLLGRMGAALTKAMQDNGIIACPKHYALNSIEDLRFSANAIADERTLHEVYLPHFKKCIDAGAMSVMGAYNKVNGTYACENKKLLTDILRDKWEFDGFTLSDFFYGIYDAVRSLKAGMDMEMPYIFRYATLGYSLKKGDITEKDIDTAAARILRALISTLPKHKKYPESVILSKEHVALARETATKGIVLLKNKDKVLPIPADKKIAVVGRYANKRNTGDHGSSNVFSPYAITPYEGMCNRFGTENVSLYNGCNISDAVKASADCDYILVCVGSDWLQEGEFLVNLGNVKKKPKGSGGDRADLHIPEEDMQLIKGLSDLGKKLVVNIMGGSAYIIKDWIDCADAVLMSFYSGLEGGNALADILSGDISPAGKLPFTVAEKAEDYPSFLHLGAKNKDIEYGYYHGYTLFDKENKAPHFPFGFGLSYTDFEFGDVSLEKDDKKITVSLKLENKGNFDGDEILQLYIGSDNADADRPVKLLKGFRRVAVRKGESAVAEVSADIEDIRFYNPATSEWELDSAYTVYIGTDSKNVIEAGKINF